MGDAHGGHAAGAGREFDRMAVQDQMGEFKNVEEFLERMHMRVEGTASGERSEAESGVHGADRSVDQAGACHANAVLEVFLRWPAIRRSCLLYTSPSPRDGLLSRMPSSA